MSYTIHHPPNLPVVSSTALVPSSGLVRLNPHNEGRRKGEGQKGDPWAPEELRYAPWSYGPPRAHRGRSCRRLVHGVFQLFLGELGFPLKRGVVLAWYRRVLKWEI